MFLKQERTLMKEAKNYMSLTLNALLRPSHVSNPLFRFSTSKHSKTKLNYTTYLVVTSDWISTLIHRIWTIFFKIKN